MSSNWQASIQSLLESAPNVHAAVSIYHFESDQQFHHNADELFYAASLIKVPIMAAVFEQASLGHLSFSEKITLLAEDQVGGSGVLYALSPGLELSIYDLTVLMIIDSDNTATNLLIDRVGKANIKQHLRDWGLTTSEFYNKLMIIPAQLEGSNRITARDMTHLLTQIATGKIVSWHAGNEMIKILKQQKYRDGLPSLLGDELDEPIGRLPDWQVANKTGWISTVDHDMGLLYFPGHTFAVTVLTKNFTDRKDAKRLQGEIGRILYEAAQK